MPFYDLRKIEEKYGKVVAQRIKIIEFYEKYGEKAMRDAFNVARSTVFLWKKRLKNANYDSFALIPLLKSTY